MAETGGKRIKGLLLELGAVFFGVLIALAADSMWETRQEHQRELDYVRALVVDMTAARDTLITSIGQAEEGGDAYARLLSRAVWGSPNAEGAPLDSVPTFPVVFLPTGTLDALITTGDVNLIRDEHLRETIVREHTSIHDAKSWLAREEAGLISLRMDFLEPVRRSDDAQMGIFPSEEEMVQLARTDPKFAAVLTSIMMTLGSYEQAQERMLSSVNTLLGAAEAALGSR